MLNVLIVLLGLGVIVGVHELCHMLTAKAFGIKVLKFSFGFGTRLLYWQRKETSYELRLLPLGGFVQFDGEDPGTKVEGGFFNVSWYKRALVALAGPLSNILLGVFIIFVLLLCKQWPILDAVEKTFEISSKVIVETLKWIIGIFKATSHASDLSGPITVTKIMASSLKESIGQFLLILSVVSLSMGLFNLLPLPALDGGHVVLYIAEGLRGKSLPTKVYIVWNYIGYILLASLMGFIIFKDIVKLFN